MSQPKAALKRWVRLTSAASIPLREGRAVRVGAEEVAVFNLGDRFLAIQNRCPHRNGPLADGIVSGDAVVCPLHAWKVGLETGAVSRPADTMACVQTFPAREESGIVLVEMPVASEIETKAARNCPERSECPTSLSLYATPSAPGT